MGRGMARDCARAPWCPYVAPDSTVILAARPRLVTLARASVVRFTPCAVLYCWEQDLMVSVWVGVWREIAPMHRGVRT